MQAPPPSSSLEQVIAKLSKKIDDLMVKVKVLNKKQIGDSLSEQKTIIKRDDQGLDYMEEMHEDLVQEEHDTQHTLSQLTNAYSTHEECNFSSQPQQNLRSMHEVEVQRWELT